MTGRGSQWEKIRKEAKRRTPFCACCGTFKRLQVHHIIPFRLTFDNRQVNLIPLCIRCHKRVEMQWVEYEATQPNLSIALLAWRSMMLERRDATRAKLLSIVETLRIAA